MTEFRANRQPLVSPGEIAHHVGDMTATIAADVALEAAQNTLAGKDQWLPIDGDPSLAIGELVEMNSTGPLRLGYGAWRDLLLGAQVTNGRGELITAGGRTMKNVAGYDLTKFMVGQGGVFGKLVTITTRTYKRPAGAILATFAPQPRLIDRLIPSPLRPQWTVLTPDALLCGYLGDERTIDFYAGALAELKPVSVERRTLQQDIDHRARLWNLHGAHFRASIAPAKLSQFLLAAGISEFAADAAFGIVIGPGGDGPRLRRAVRELGGIVSFHSGTNFTCELSPENRALLERLKYAFDPDHHLKPLP